MKRKISIMALIIPCVIYLIIACVYHLGGYVPDYMHSWISVDFTMSTLIISTALVILCMI